MQVTKDNFITARYIDNEKKNVEILYKDGDKNISHIIEHDIQHPDWEELMAITSIDELHANTHAYIKASQKDFKKMVMKIAKEEGLVKEVVAELSTKFYDEVFEFFFNYDDKQKEMLFNFKLFIFEKEFVKNSTDTETKAIMRKAQSPIEVMNAVMKLK
tara:strand:+ start:433 stop:909 length:477 start_codon:yes stop_codon:yes gene_type:complete